MDCPQDADQEMFTSLPVSTKAVMTESLSRSGVMRGVSVGSVPKEVDGVSLPSSHIAVRPSWERLRIVQAPCEEMSPEQQWQPQQLRGPSGPATQLLGEADGTCPELF